LDGERATRYLASDTKNEILLSAATEITDRYYELAADLVSVVSAQIQIALLEILDLLDSMLKTVFFFLKKKKKKTVIMSRQGRQSLLSRKLGRVHKDELEQVQMSQIIMCLTLIKSVCSCSLIFRLVA